MSGKRIRGVVFDLDGTLYELGARQLRLTLALLRDVRILRHMSGVRRWMRGRSFRDRAELTQVFHAELGRRTGMTEQRAAKWYEERFLAAFVRMLARKARTRPGLVELLRSLREKDVRLAVVSDFGHVDQRLEAIRVPAELFDATCSAEDFGTLKPSPRPLEELARRWGVEPGEMMMVGDRRDLDAPCAELIGGEFLELGSWSDAVRVLEERTGATERVE